MSRNLLLGTFTNEHDLVAATTAARERAYPIVDAYTPYPVHGLDKAMGLKPSRLSVFCFVMGVAGVGLAMLLQHWTMAIDWPINVGGRPFNSWPAYVPVAFEVLVLLAGFGVVFAFFGVSRMYPGKAAKLAGASVTNDRFVLVIEATGAAVDSDAVLLLFRKHHAIEALERDEVSHSPSASSCNAKLVNGLLGGLLILTIVLNWSLSTNHSTPNREFLPDMVQAVPYESFARHPDLPNHMALQPPVEGTIARGQKPLHYQPTPKDAERAGEELVNPFSAKDDLRLKRSAQVYANYCQLCHGLAGKGDGPVSQRGVPPPPSLLADKTLKMKDGQMFHVITYGQGNMAAYAGQISLEDRWAVILHLRQLQKPGGVRP